MAKDSEPITHATLYRHLNGVYCFIFVAFVAVLMDFMWFTFFVLMLAIVLQWRYLFKWWHEAPDDDA